MRARPFLVARRTFWPCRRFFQVGLCSLIAACQPLPPADSGATLSAAGSIRIALTPSERLLFSKGASLFKQPWVTAPSTTSDRDGLGPLFNSHSCEGCHRHHGRGSLETGLLFRLYDNRELGDQLQPRAIAGLQAEGLIEQRFSEETRTFAEGDTLQLRRPHYQAAPHLFFSPRLAPALAGLGLIEKIPQADIIALADPDDRDSNGISGRVNSLGDRIGRFGWKAEQASLLDQTARALSEDLGISSSLITTTPQPANCLVQGVDLCRRHRGGEPEISDADLQALTGYLGQLSVPQAQLSETHRPGWNLFLRAGCQNCHHIQWSLDPKTTIYPYSDFLLHDMGDDLADHAEHPLAREWRTAPLWGLNQSKGPYLHDGRARTLMEAILWHGGEAAQAQQEVLQMSSNERQSLIEFLSAL